MKILRLFDSLRFVRAIFVAVACVFILNVAHAATTAIQSVIAYGKTEQNGTPTPTNPAPIMTNNGVLKVSPNLFDINTVVVGKAVRAGNTSAESPLGSEMDNAQWSCSDYIRVQPNTIYTYVIPKSTNASAAGMVFYSNKSVESAISGITQKSSLTRTFTTPANCNYVRFSWMNSDGNAAKLVQGTSADGIYTNGLTETIRDAAGHKATAEMLLSVGDYKDEQNITTGAITRKVGVKVFDGTEDWVVVAGADYFRLDGMFEDTIPYASDNPAIVCSHFVGRQPKTGASGMNDKDIKLGYTSTHNRLYLKYYNMTSADDLKQWLAEQYAAGTPVIVVYPLATETTENVAAQSLTTAPVRQTLGAIMNMPIVTTLTDGTVIGDLIRVATTKYNEESFEDVQGALTGVFNAVDTVVTQTMTQAQAIDTIATSKQTRPDEGCTAKYCLLVEDEQGVPHWYPIAGVNGVAHNLPAGYTELQYTYMTSGAYLLTDIVPTYDGRIEMDFETTTFPSGSVYLLGGRTETYGGIFFVKTSAGVFMVDAFGNTVADRYTSSVTAQNNTRYKFTYDNQVATVESGGTTLFTNTFTSENANGAALCINGWNNNGTITASQAGIYLYSFKVWNAQGELVANYIPAKQTNPLTVGFYDTVSKIFKTATAGTFTAGPDM